MIRFVLASLFLLVAGTASADEIKVLSAVGYKPILNELGPSYEKQSGHKVKIEYDSPSAIARRLGGKVMELGRQLGVATPTHSLMYAALKPYILGAPA